MGLWFQRFRVHEGRTNAWQQNNWEFVSWATCRKQGAHWETSSLPLVAHLPQHGHAQCFSNSSTNWGPVFRYIGILGPFSFKPSQTPVSGRWQIEYHLLCWAEFLNIVLDVSSFLSTFEVVSRESTCANIPVFSLCLILAPIWFLLGFLGYLNSFVLNMNSGMFFPVMQSYICYLKSLTVVWGQHLLLMSVVFCFYKVKCCFKHLAYKFTSHSDFLWEV